MTCTPSHVTEWNLYTRRLFRLHLLHVIFLLLPWYHFLPQWQSALNGYEPFAVSYFLIYVPVPQKIFTGSTEYFLFIFMEILVHTSFNLVCPSLHFFLFYCLKLLIPPLNRPALLQCLDPVCISPTQSHARGCVFLVYQKLLVTLWSYSSACGSSLRDAASFWPTLP